MSELERRNDFRARIAELEAEVERTRDAWMETAAFHHRNEEYYRGLVVRIGEMLPLPDAYVSDDGSAQDSVLCAKVPELVQASVAHIAELEAERDDLKQELQRVNVLCETVMEQRREAQAERDRLKERLASLVKYHDYLRSPNGPPGVRVGGEPPELTEARAALSDPSGRK